MSEVHYQYIPSSPSNPKNGYITLANEKVFVIVNEYQFYMSLGYTREIMESGLLPEEFMWFEYRQNKSKKSEARFQVKITEYLAEQKLALIKLIREGDKSTKQETIVSYMELVADTAERYKKNGDESYNKIIQCCFGIIHALENFELDGYIPDFLLTQD